MKKELLLLAFAGLAMQTNAQGFVKKAETQVATPQITNLTPDPSGSGVLAPQPATARGVEIQIGGTMFDLQTYNSVPQRIGTDADSKVSAIWMSGSDITGGWPDRGTSAAWQDETGEFTEGARVENADIRTGFPTMCVLGDGSQVSFAHRTTNSPPFAMQVNKRAAGSATWTVSDVPTTIDGGLLWPSATAGGSDGNTIHLVAINDIPNADRNLMYYRSQDGGDTWDVQDVLLPGMEDTTLFRSMDAQAYSIAANGNTVAIAIFPGWGDVRMYKSEDNGTTWTYKTVIDFPLDGYITDTGYDSTAVQPYRFDAELYTSSYTIFTNDGSGDIAIDQNGQVHVTFGQMYVLDETIGDANTSIYGGVTGLMYWNESMPEDTAIYIADLVDTDGDGTFGTTTSVLVDYFQNNVTGHPGMAINNAGEMFVVYQSPTDLNVNIENNKHYNHIHIVKSSDGGATWTAPYDLINATLADPDAIDIEETVYPSIAADVDGNIHIVYQMDYTIDAFVNDATIPVGDNYIVYLGLTPELDIISKTVVPVSGSTDMRIMPNVTSGLATVSIKATTTATGELKVFNQFGQVVSTQISNVVAGENTLSIDLSDMPSGNYHVVFAAADKVFSAPVVVQK